MKKVTKSIIINEHNNTLITIALDHAGNQHYTKASLLIVLCGCKSIKDFISTCWQCKFFDRWSSITIHMFSSKVYDWIKVLCEGFNIGHKQINDDIVSFRKLLLCVSYHESTYTMIILILEILCRTIILTTLDIEFWIDLWFTKNFTLCPILCSLSDFCWCYYIEEIISLFSESKYK